MKDHIINIITVYISFFIIIGFTEVIDFPIIGDIFFTMLIISILLYILEYRHQGKNGI